MISRTYQTSGNFIDQDKAISGVRLIPMMKLSGPLPSSTSTTVSESYERCLFAKTTGEKKQGRQRICSMFLRIGHRIKGLQGYILVRLTNSGPRRNFIAKMTIP